MRKVLILIIVSLFTFNVINAQANRTGTLATFNGTGVAKTHDTLTNTDTVYMWDGRNDHNQWGQVGFQYLTTQLTGTVTPTTIVQGSNDATTIVSGTWYTLKNCTLCQTLGLVDTGTTKAVKYDFLLPECNWRYIRIRTITSGTHTSVPSGVYFLAQPLIKLN